ncbi:unnamed protein product [Closterium sp. NIES-54]
MQRPASARDFVPGTPDSLAPYSYSPAAPAPLFHCCSYALVPFRRFASLLNLHPCIHRVTPDSPPSPPLHPSPPTPPPSPAPPHPCLSCPPVGPPPCLASTVLLSRKSHPPP